MNMISMRFFIYFLTRFDKFWKIYDGDNLSPFIRNVILHWFKRLFLFMLAFLMKKKELLSRFWFQETATNWKRINNENERNSWSKMKNIHQSSQSEFRIFMAFVWKCVLRNYKHSCEDRWMRRKKNEAKQNYRSLLHETFIFQSPLCRIEIMEFSQMWFNSIIIDCSVYKST